MTENMEEIKRDLAYIKENLSNGGHCGQSKKANEQIDNAEKQGNTIDPAVFLDI